MLMFILSGCSGAGKNTVIHALMQSNNQVDIFTSITTREKRPSEIQGNPFYYYTLEEFEQKDKQGLIIEKEFIHGNYYGTSYEVLEEKLAQDKILIKDIGVEGTLNLQRILKNKLQIIPVFLDVPKKELIKRITLRGEPKDRVKVRASRFNYELSFRKHYEYIFKHLSIDESVNALQSIINMYNCSFDHCYTRCSLNNKKLQKYIQKLNENKKIPAVKLGFYDNKLVILKNLESYIAGLKTNKPVQKLVYSKYFKNAIKYVVE